MAVKIRTEEEVRAMTAEQRQNYSDALRDSGYTLFVPGGQFLTGAEIGLKAAKEVVEKEKANKAAEDISKYKALLWRSYMKQGGARGEYSGFQPGMFDTIAKGETGNLLPKENPYWEKGPEPVRSGNSPLYTSFQQIRNLDPGNRFIKPGKYPGGTLLNPINKFNNQVENTIKNIFKF